MADNFFVNSVELNTDKAFSFQPEIEFRFPEKVLGNKKIISLFENSEMTNEKKRETIQKCMFQLQNGRSTE